MLPRPTVQNRAKQIHLSLARELFFIEREHSQYLIAHQKLENSIRRTNSLSSADKNGKKISVPFNQIYNEQTGSIDYQNLRDSHINSSQKVRLSFGGATSSSSSFSQIQTNLDRNDEFSDDTSSFISIRRRRYCTKTQRLPPIIKPNVSNQQKREHKNRHWMDSYQRKDRSKEDLTKRFTIFNDEVTPEPILPELTPIQRQVRSFLETLPTYKGVQHGFDSFARASLYSTRAPIVIR